MDCPHCGKAFHDEWKIDILRGDASFGGWWAAVSAVCPACKGPIFRLKKARRGDHPDGHERIIEIITVYPKHTFRAPTPKEVPTKVREDYEEACKVLPDSEKASAALSRRCLQAILRGQGYAQTNLAQQVDALLTEPDPARAIPTALRQAVDAIRNFGNFSAHPVTDQTTLQIIDVEAGEAEWCLEILEEMFDHYYVKPEHIKARKAALDAKLAAAGKPPSKA